VAWTIQCRERRASNHRKNPREYRFIYANTQGWTILAAQLEAVFVEHLTSEQLAAFLANTLSDADRRSAEHHFVSCAECRSELIQAQRAVASAPSKQFDRRWFGIVGLAAAAAIAVMFLPRGAAVKSSPAIEREVQTPAPADAGTVEIVSPAANGEVTISPTFVWRRNDDASYKITVTDAAGRPAWSGATSDTSIALPDSIRLAAGAQFFWYVDALRSDGRSVTSGVNNFHTSR
jgi:hypothetical protein